MTDSIERFLKVCDVAVVGGNVMADKWRKISFQQFNCYKAEEKYERECVPDDNLFRTEVTRRTFEPFTRRGDMFEQGTSIMPLIRTDAWITAVI